MSAFRSISKVCCFPMLFISVERLQVLSAWSCLKSIASYRKGGLFLFRGVVIPFDHLLSLKHVCSFPAWPKFTILVNYKTFLACQLLMKNRLRRMHISFPFIFKVKWIRFLLCIPSNRLFNFTLYKRRQWPTLLHIMIYLLKET